MATVSSTNEFVVYKFFSSGLVALCAEVAAYAQRGDFEQFGVDVDSATYRRVQEGPDSYGEHQIVFTFKES